MTFSAAAQHTWFINSHLEEEAGTISGHFSLLTTSNKIEFTQMFFNGFWGPVSEKELQQTPSLSLNSKIRNSDFLVSEQLVQSTLSRFTHYCTLNIKSQH